MTPSGSSISSILASFPYEQLTKIGQNGGKPNFTTLQVLKDELISNSASVYSKLGGGNNGHIFLILPTAEFRQLTITPTLTAGITTPTAPNAPDLVNGADDTAYKIYKQALSDHLLYHNTSRALVNQIVSAVPLLYIKAVRHKITKFGNITPKELLDHLSSTYGEITAEDMNQNELRMNAKWMPPTPIEELFDQLREAQIFAAGAAISQEITDGMLMRSAYNNIKATGLFTLPCYTWNQIGPVNQSFETLQAHFAKVDRDRQGEAIAADLGYGTANSVDCQGNDVGTPTTDGTELSALTEAITQQNVANAALFANMMVAMNVAEKSTTKNRLPATQGTYCWTHGRSDNVSHTSATCKSPAEGHDVEATWNNKKGGSTRCWGAK